MFLYYTDEESDKVIGGSTKTVEQSMKSISRNITAMFFELDAINVHHKRNKMYNSYATGPVLIKTKMCILILNKDHPFPTI